MTSSDAALGDHIKCPFSLQSPACLAERGFVPSVDLGETAVLCDECRLVPEGQFGLVGYVDSCVRYDLLRTVWHW